jgi:hypothetical protein
MMRTSPKINCGWQENLFDGKIIFWHKRHMYDQHKTAVIKNLYIKTDSISCLHPSRRQCPEGGDR